MIKLSVVWKKFINFLNEPFSAETSFSSELKSSFFTGLFIALFLLLFKPFDLASAGSDLYKYVVGYGLITFVVSLIYGNIYNRFVNTESTNFTFWKWFLSVMGLIIFIAIGNLGLWVFLNETSVLNWRALLFSLYVTLMVGIFPILAGGAYRVYSNKIKYANIASSIETDLKTNSDKPSKSISLENIVFDRSDFLYAEAMENYVKMTFEKERVETIRITMKELESELEEFHLVRCHRSYIVNPMKVSSVSGNAQGLKLKLSDSDFEIPVSRKYVSKIRAILA